MTEVYDLIGEVTPTIPNPHDCVVRDILFDAEYLTLKFGDDISLFDSIKFVRSNAVSLTIRFHLTDPEFELYKCKKTVFGKKKYELIDIRRLKATAKSCPEYLEHLVGYGSVCVRLFDRGEYMLFVDADRVEYEWSDK